MLKNLKVGVRLALGFVLMIIMLVVIAALSMVRLQNLQSSIHVLVEDRYAKVIQVNDAIDQVNIIARALRNMILWGGNLQEVAAEEKRILESRATATEIIDHLTAAITSDEGKRRLAVLNAARQLYITEQNKIIDLAKIGQAETDAQATALLLGNYRDLQTAYIATWESLKEFQTGLAEADAKAAEILTDNAIMIIMVMSISAVLLAILFAILITRSIVNPLSLCIKAADKLAKGDTALEFDTSGSDELAALQRAMKTMTDAIKSMVSDAAMLVTAAVEGRLKTRADETKHSGDFRNIVRGVNETLDAVIGPLNVTARYVDDISKGVIPPIITDNYNGDFNLIKNNLNAVVKMMSELLSETDIIINGAADGELDKRANADKFLGGWNKLVVGINETITNIVNPLMVTADYVDKISKGAIPEEITTIYKGQYNIIKTNLNACIRAVGALVADANMLSDAAVAGALQTRADATKHSGDYRKIVEGVNKTLDLVITPINETIAILKRLAEGDMTLRMTGDYKGDFDVLKIALNDSLNSINDTLGQINTAVDQVAEGSIQVSQASQALSQGATEQASSLEEITSSTTEISSQTKQNTENAVKVNGLAREAQSNAEKGNNQMKELVSAMSDINTSAEEIKKVVKTIDDISFQINLLALNANVEAARAGKYGKGFAVVAEEVRNLAVRSANSVKDTTLMVEGTITNIQRGNSLVEGTAKQLDEIVGGAAQVASLAEEVATAGREQTQGLDQIALGLNQIDQVTQSNTASAEESASASEELSSQAQQVKAMLSRFKLKASENKLNSSEVIAMLRAELAHRDGAAHRQSAPLPAAGTAAPAKKSAVPAGRAKATGLNPADIISLDDNNFGKF